MYIPGKALLVAALLAATTSAGPVPSTEYDAATSSTSPNIHKLETRSITRVFRADTRLMAEIIKQGGFKAKGHAGNDRGILQHVAGAKKNNYVSPYVSTSSDLRWTEGWLKSRLGGKGMIYEIAAYPNLIDTIQTLGDYHPKQEQSEFVAPLEIELGQILAYYEYTLVGKEMKLVKRHPNEEHYDKTKYDGQSIGGPKYDLAGFEEGHAAWSEEPWVQYATCKKTKRSPESNTQTPQGRTGTQSSRTRPNTQGNTQSNMQGSPTTTTPKCTAAMKKAGKCAATKKGRCGPARSTKVVFDEFVRMIKSGRVPKSSSSRPTSGRRPTRRPTQA